MLLKPLFGIVRDWHSTRLKELLLSSLGKFASQVVTDGPGHFQMCGVDLTLVGPALPRHEHGSQTMVHIVHRSH